jgi:hypothetical protein
MKIVILCISGTSSSVKPNLFASDVEVWYDPPKNGACQFSCLATDLNCIGISTVTGEPWNAEAIRKELVDFITTYRVQDQAGQPYFQEFVRDCKVSQYVEKMHKLTEFVDHLTLKSAALRFDIKIVVISSNGSKHDVVISGTSSTSF